MTSSEVRVPDVYGAIEAYRAWRIDSDGDLLTSVAFRGEGWRPGEVFSAVCRDYLKDVRPEHPAPARGCGCGIHVVNDFHDANFLRFNSLFFTTPKVIGRVKIWGRVVTHQNGYRAQFARPVALFTERKTPALIRIARRYQIPLEYRNDLPNFAKYEWNEIKLAAKLIRKGNPIHLPTARSSA